MSRNLSPGEAGRWRGGTQNTNTYNRVLVGQIRGVNPQNGTIDVFIPSTGQKLKMVMAVTGLSVHSFRSAWQRFMPDIGDFVKVGFGPDARPQCLGMAAWGHEESVGGATGRTGASGYHVGGYARLSKLRKDNVAGLREWSELKPGEWDFRSSGGAYIKGARSGTLLMRTGCTKREFDKDRNEIRDRAGMWELEEGGSRMRFGDIKRRLSSGDFNDTKVDDSGKEWDVQVIHKNSAVTQKTYWTSRIGDVRDDDGNVENGPHGEALRVKQVVFEAVTQNPETNLPPKVENYTFTVDKNGNVDMTHGSATTKVTITAASATWENNFSAIKNIASGQHDVSGATINLNAGGGADNFIVRGDDLITWLTSFINATFNAHVHPTAFGPSGAPVVPGVPPTPVDFLSTAAKVK